MGNLLLVKYDRYSVDKEVTLDKKQATFIFIPNSIFNTLDIA